MGKLRRDLGDISESLETQHMNPNDTKIGMSKESESHVYYIYMINPKLM